MGSPHDEGTAYLCATRYKLADTTPYLYKTTDWGATWTAITGDLPADAFTRVIRADPHRRGLLYCGTETGIFASFDDGAHWQPLGGNLPVITTVYGVGYRLSDEARVLVLPHE